MGVAGRERAAELTWERSARQTITRLALEAGFDLPAAMAIDALELDPSPELV
jgi:hypothetical protein